ncbi:MAG: tRNA (guanine(46)-N(7))-methyltransferase TrmB [bacterium]
MVANSRQVSSNQTGIHPDLDVIVEKHCFSLYRLPVQGWMQILFDQLQESLDLNQPIILDSGCGTAESVMDYAQQHPGEQVIGLDRSSERLRKAGLEQNLWQRQDNAWLVRCRIEEFWSLAHQAGWQLKHHRILYPNPYPKSSQLKRRWHAHPAFPWLIAMGGKLELRSNWATYIKEFSQALKLQNINSNITQIHQTQAPVSAFERKYLQSGQAVYVLEADLDVA